MDKFYKTNILNDKGENVYLSKQEYTAAQILNSQKSEEIKNAFGYEIDVTTLTAITKSVVEQKFFTVAPSDFIPVVAGNNAWSASILTYRDYSISGPFSAGNINTGQGSTRLAESDAAFDSISVPVMNWAKQISWSIPELQIAARSGNWDVVTSKERSRKKNWDLGIQEVAFLGLQDNAGFKGLLNLDTVTSNTTLITKYIKAMTSAEFDALVQGLIAAYRINSQYTAKPTHFVIPEADFNGLTAPVSASFPNISKLEYLLTSFRTATQNPNFQIRGLAYADQAQNAGYNGLNKNRYVLYNYDQDTLRMDIPVDYTATLQNTINGFQYQNVGYGQYTGTEAYRPREILYFDWAA